MLHKFKESVLVKKIYLIIMILLIALLLTALISPNPSLFKFGTICFTLIIVAFTSRMISFLEWGRKNMHILRDYVRKGIFLFGCLIIGLTASLDYTLAFKNILTMSSIFLFFIFYLHCLSKNKEDEELIFKLLKIFFSVFVLMTIMIYNTYKDGILLQNEYLKTEIQSVEKNKKEILLDEYNRFIKSHLVLFTPSEIKNEKKEPHYINNPKFHVFVNPASTIIVISILYCLIILINNYSLLQNQSSIKKLKYKKHIRSR